MIKSQINTRNTFTHHPSFKIDKIKFNCPSLTTYTPTPYLFSWFLQMVFTLTLGSKPGQSLFCDAVTYDRSFLSLPDGGLISIDWLHRSSNRILVISPGLASDSQTSSVRLIALEAHNRDFSVAVIHGRGVCCDLKTAKVLSICNWKDYKFSIEKIQQKYPGKEIVGIGVSMGGSILAKYAAKSGEKCLLKALVVIGAPLDFVSHYAELEKDRFTDFLISELLKKAIRNFEPKLKQWENEIKEKGICFESIYKAKKSKEIDELFNARLLGIDRHIEYYKKGGCVDLMENISIKFLGVYSRDDPVVCLNTLPFQKFRENQNLLLAITNSGGHMGFLQGVVPRRWFPVPCLEFLESSLKEI